MKVNFEPSVNHYLVKQQEVLDVTEGGLFVPDNAKERPMEGVVIAVNKYSHVKDAPDNALYKVKDVVVFGKYDGVEIKVDGEIYLILDHRSILGKIIGS